MINCKLTKVSSNPNNLRTNEMIGYTHHEPMIGQSFLIINDDPIEKEGNTNRAIYTSTVVSLTRGAKGILFKTQNSEYLFERLEEI